MTVSQKSRRSLRVGAVAAMAAFGMVAPLALAQTPMAGMVAHPGHIHSGTCAELGDVVVPLTDAAMPEGEMMGPESALPLVTSQTVVDVPLADIISGGHAINFHESADAIDVYIACGDIGGAVTEGEEGEQQLTIALGELNDSGYYGIAWLGADGDQTEVAVSLFQVGE